MEILRYESIEDFGDLLYEIAAEEKATATAVLFYKEARELMKWLLQFDDVKIGCIDLADDGYEKEYYVTLDEDMYLYVETAYDDSGYQAVDTEAIFFDGDASATIAHINGGSLQFELETGKEESEETEGDEAEEPDWEIFKGLMKLIGVF